MKFYKLEIIMASFVTILFVGMIVSTYFRVHPKETLIVRINGGETKKVNPKIDPKSYIRLLVQDGYILVNEALIEDKELNTIHRILTFEKDGCHWNCMKKEVNKARKKINYIKFRSKYVG